MNFDYCPNCGYQATVQKQSDTDYLCSECGWRFWNNPKSTASIIFLRGNDVLISKRRDHPFKGKYDFPGGFLEFGEDPYDAAIREAKEETSVDIARPTLVEVATHEYIPGTSVVDIVFVVTSWQGKFAARDDSAGLSWKPIDFINDPNFAWKYPGLDIKLKALTQVNASGRL